MTSTGIDTQGLPGRLAPASAWAAFAVARIALAVGLGLALFGPALAAEEAGPASRWPPVLAEVAADSLDNPTQVLHTLAARLAALDARADASERFWLHLAIARLAQMLEKDQAAAESTEHAKAVLASMPAPTAEQRAWLAFMQLRQRVYVDGTPEIVADIAAARTTHGVVPGTVLACELDEIEAWLLRELSSYDEAWRLGESLEACADAARWPAYRAGALADRAQIAGDVGRATPERVAAMFDEAYRAVGPGEGRFLRSLVAYAAAGTLMKLDRLEDAERHLTYALSASRALADDAGIAAALIDQGRLAVLRKRPTEALAPLREAEPILQRVDHGESSRLVSLYAVRLKAMAALRHPDLASTLARAGELVAGEPVASATAGFERARAEAMAALGRHAQAYEAMRRVDEAVKREREGARSAQVLRLQALYDSSRRDAELTALRHAQETAKLSLETERATARALWLALAVAAMSAVLAAVVGWRQWQRRRETLQLALRDPLTGLPNRRAIEAYARAQLSQARRLSLPFTLALIDHDRFKEVNDRHGHATGDVLLRAFADAAPKALRAPDRLGRWGGEEFLLVLPGTAQAELPTIFERMCEAFAAVRVPGLPEPHGRTFSAGGAEAGAASTSLEDLVAEADRRLYQAKDAGRNRLV